jgi:hypothetical protein
MEWLLRAEDSWTVLLWEKLGPVTWSADRASIPIAPATGGIYMIKVMLDGRYRIYIGEAANLRKRLRRYGGRGAERPNQQGKTASKMKGRLRRSCRAGGTADVYLLRLPICSEPAMYTLDVGCKDCRITLERLALSCA